MRLAVAVLALALLGATYGYPNRVATANTLTVYGRTYTFTTDCGPVPRIAAGAEAVIASCSWSVGGSPLIWSAPSIVGRTRQATTFGASATAGSFALTATAECDDAGICFIEVEAENTTGSAANLTLSYTVTLGVDDYRLHHLKYDPATFAADKLHAATMAGPFESESLAFLPSYYAGSPTAGVEFVWEGDYNWTPADRTGQTPIVVTSGTTDTLAVTPLPSGSPLSVPAAGTWEHRFTVTGFPLRKGMWGEWEYHNANASQYNAGWYRSDIGRSWNETITSVGSTFESVYDGSTITRLKAGATTAFAVRAAISRTGFYAAAARSAHLDPVYFANRLQWATSSTLFTGSSGVFFYAQGKLWREHLNADGKPFWPPFAPPLGNGTSSTDPSALCKAEDDPYDCCTDKATGTCTAANNYFGYRSGCKNDPDEPSEWDYKRTQILRTVTDPRWQPYKNVYFDHGNLSDSCSLDERITHSSQQAWPYQNLIRFYRQLWQQLKALDPEISVTIHTPGAPKTLGAYADVVLWGESLNVVFGGSQESGCADGTCNTPGEYCAPRDSGNTPLGHCQDGIDNDGDGDVDLADSGCAEANDDTEDEGRTAGGFCANYARFDSNWYDAIRMPPSGYVPAVLPQANFGSTEADHHVWARVLFGALWSRGVNHWIARLGSATDSTRAQLAALEAIGSFHPDDMLVTPASQVAASLTAPAGLVVGAFAHPSMDCTFTCDLEGLLVVHNPSLDTIAGDVVLTDAAALGLAGVNEYREFDPANQPSAPTPTYGDWTVIGDGISVSIPARDYKIFHLRVAP